MAYKAPCRTETRTRCALPHAHAARALPHGHSPPHVLASGLWISFSAEASLPLLDPAKFFCHIYAASHPQILLSSPFRPPFAPHSTPYRPSLWSGTELPSRGIGPCTHRNPSEPVRKSNGRSATSMRAWSNGFSQGPSLGHPRPNLGFLVQSKDLVEPVRPVALKVHFTEPFLFYLRLLCGGL